MKNVIVFSFVFLIVSCGNNEKVGYEPVPQFVEKASIYYYKEQCVNLDNAIRNEFLCENKVDTISINLIQYLDSLKTMIVINSKQEDPKTMELKIKEKMNNIDSIYSAISLSLLMIGEEETSPKLGKWSAREVVEKVENYKRELDSLGYQNIPFNHLNTRDLYEYGGRIKLTPEIYWFHHKPLIECLRLITNQQTEILRIAISLKKKKK